MNDMTQVLKYGPSSPASGWGGPWGATLRVNFSTSTSYVRCVPAGVVIYNLRLGVRILPELACRCSNSGYSGVPAVTPEFRSLYCDRQTGLCGRSGLPGSGPVCSQLNLKYKLLSFIVKVQVAKNGCFSRPPSSDFRWMHHMFAASKSSGSMLMFIQ